MTDSIAVQLEKHGIPSDKAKKAAEEAALVIHAEWRGLSVVLLITHSEFISIPDFLVVKERDNLLYLPTVHYAYHLCNEVLLMQPKTASGPFYAATAHHLGVTRWEASPHMMLDGRTTEFASGDVIQLSQKEQEHPQRTRIAAVH